MCKLTTLFVAAALASLSASALADEGARVLKKQAKATYEMDKKSCKSLSGDEKDRCEHRAKAQYDQEREQIKTDEKADNAKGGSTLSQKWDNWKREHAHSGNQVPHASTGSSVDGGRPVSNLDGVPESANKPTGGN